MTALVWDELDDRVYSYGVDRGVLYTGPEKLGVEWNGLINIEESHEGGERTPLYFDGVKYLDSVGNRAFTGVLTAFSAPKEFDPCLGYQSVRPGFILTGQPKEIFHLTYRTMTSDGGYKIHVVHNVTATPTQLSHQTIGETVDPTIKAWKIDAVPPGFAGVKPAAHVVLDSRVIDPELLSIYEDTIYGTPSTPPQLP